MRRIVCASGSYIPRREGTQTTHHARHNGIGTRQILTMDRNDKMMRETTATTHWTSQKNCPRHCKRLLETVLPPRMGSSPPHSDAKN